MTYEQFKKSALEKKTQTNNISDAYKKFKENALNPTQKEETQTITMPKFKTLEEAQAYAKANNINAVSTGAKIPNLVNIDKINKLPTVQELMAQQEEKTFAEKAGEVARNVGEGIYNTVGSIGYGIGSIVAKPVAKGGLALGSLIKTGSVDWDKINSLVEGAEARTIEEYGNMTTLVNVSKTATDIGLSILGTSALKSLGLSAKLAPMISYGAVGGTRALGDSDTAIEVLVETAKSATYGAIVSGTKNLLAGKALTSTTTKTALSTAMEFGANFVKNAISHATASAITQTYDILKYFKENPNYNYIDWEKVEKYIAEGKYNSVEEFLDSPDYTKMVMKNRGSQIVLASLIGGFFDTIADSIISKNIQKQTTGMTKKEALTKLGLKANASEADIKSAYRKLAKMYHPDVNGGNESKFIEIQEAYNSIMNKVKPISTTTTPKPTTPSTTPITVNKTPTSDFSGVSNIVSSNIQANINQSTNNQVQQMPTNQQKEWKPSNQVATQSTNPEMTKLNKNDQVAENVQKEEMVFDAEINRVDSMIEDELESNISEDFDITDTAIEGIAENIVEKTYKQSEEALNDEDIAYDEFLEYSNEIYKKIESKLKELGFDRYEGSFGRGGYHAASKLYDAREQLIEYLDNNDIAYEESKSIYSGLFPSIYVKNSDGNVVLRIGNHKNSRGASQTYTNKDIIENTNKIIEDIKKAVSNDIRYDKMTKVNKVDISESTNYNDGVVARKKEPTKYVYKRISDKDKARVNSDYMQNESKYIDKNFVHFDDVSYAYAIKNGEIEILKKFKGSQKFINDVEEAWENGFDKLSNGNIKVAKSIRSAKRRSNTSDGIGGGQQKSGTSNRKTIGDGRQQREIDKTKTTKNNGNDLKNSDKQGSNFMPKNIQGLEKHTEKEIKNIVSDYIQNLMPDITIKGIELNGSRMRGDAKSSSDLDVVVEYDGDISEDDLFNILNEDSLEIDGIKVDINPITAGKSGTMTEYMKKSKEYDDSLKKPDERYDAIPTKQLITDNKGRELTKEQQEYFKDSKVRDNEGNILTLYHGTNEEFNIFERNKISKNTKNAGWYGDGFYFTRDKETANRYTRTGKIKEVYLNLKNPFNIENIQALSEYRYIKNLVNLNPEWGNIYTNWMEKNTWRDVTEDYEELSKQGYDTSEIDEILFEKYGETAGREGNNVLDRLYYESVKNNYKTLSEVLKNKGYDGIVSDLQNDEYTEYVAFDSNQIKSVDNTNPTDSDDIRYDMIPIKDGFYSQLESTIINKMQRQANSKDVMNLIQKNGVKQDEIAWTGIDDFLASKETVTKEEVLEYIRANQIEIEEVIKDDSSKKEYLKRENEISQRRSELHEEIEELLDFYLVDGNGTAISKLYHHMVKTAWEDEEFTTLVNLEKFEKDGDKYAYNNYEEGARSFTKEEMLEDMRKIGKLYQEWEELNKELETMSDEGWKSDGSDAKFQEYATNWQDEYDNYREVLFTLPNAKGAKSFSSVHWGEENILAHTRLNDYKDVDGKKVLFIEEIQSDMHQAGRKHGYSNDENKLIALEKQYQEQYDKLEKLKGIEKSTDEYKKIQQISKEKERIRKNIEKNKDEFDLKYNFNIGLSGTYDLIFNFYDGYALPENNEWMAKTIAQEIATRQLRFENGSFQQGTKEIEKLMEKENLTFRESAFKILGEQKLLNLVKDYRETISKNNELVKKSIELNKEYHKAREMMSQLEIYKQISQEQSKLNELDIEIDKIKNSDSYIPSSVFPFKKNWHEFVLRQIINEAVQQGYDKVAWTTGKQQNDRYNLAKYINEIEYRINDDGTYDIYALKNNVTLKTIPNQSKEELGNLIGKELASKIINGVGKVKYPKETDSPYERAIYSLTGVDLEIGGEGMKGFYDRIVPEYLGRYLKKWNSKVEEVSIPSDYGTVNVQQGFTITPEMRESIKKTGQPLYDKEANIDNMSRKNIIEKIRTTVGIDTFSNSNKDLNNIASDIRNRIKERTITTSEINKIVKDLGERLTVKTDKYLGEYDGLRQEIKETKIYVSDTVKKGFYDWNDFRKSNFGTLRLTNDSTAMNVSEMYTDLQQRYGNDLFPDNIVNEADQLEKISEVAQNLKQTDVGIAEYYTQMYGRKGWENIAETIVDEIKAIRNEYDLENPIDKSKQAYVVDKETKEILNRIGFTNEEIYDPANGYVQNLIDAIKKNKEYYTLPLAEIEEMNLIFGGKKTNTILNKRRYDVQNGLVKANPKYSEGASLSAIRKEIEKYLGRKIGLNGFRARAYGIYKPTLDTIRIKDISNIETAIHELGHRINYKELDKSLTGASRQELNKLAERAFGNMYDKDPTTKIEEGWAEFTKRFAVDNQTTLKEYPELSAYMLEQLEGNKRIKNLIETLIELSEQYVNAPTANQIRKMQSIGEDTDKQTERNFFDKLMYEVYDDLWDIKQMTKAFAKAKQTGFWKMNPEDNIYNLMRTLRANEDRVLNVMKYGLIDDNGTRRTKGMLELIETIKNDPDKIQKVRDLMIALRTLDYSVVQLDTGLSTEEAINLISEYSKEKDVMDVANGIIKFQDEVMNYAVEKGLMTKEQYEEMRKWNRFYIPMKRVYDGKANSSTGSKGASKLTKKRTGSMRDIIDPFESIIQNTSMILTKINQNEIMKTLARLQEQTGLADFFEKIDPPQKLQAEVDLNIFKNALEEQGIDTDEIDLDIVQKIFNPVMNDDSKMIMGYMDKGKLQAIEFKDRNIYDLFSKTTNYADLGVFLEAVEKFSGILRMGATSGNLEFAVPNMISDTMTDWMFSESNFVPAVDTLKGIYDYMIANYAWADEMVKDSKYKQENKYLYDLYMQSGATMATRVASYRPEVQEYVLEVFGKHANDLISKDKNKAKRAGKALLNALIKAPQKVQDVLSILPEISEQATRFESFKKDYIYFREKGHNHKNALLQATANTRDITMDFNRMGHSMRYYNRIRAFASARTQGIYRFVEAFEKMPKKVLTKMSIMVGVALTILNMARKARNKKEEEITDQVRKDNFIIPLGKDGEIITIKKPQGVARSIINFAELMYNVATGKIKEEKYNQAWLNWIKDMVEENAPLELDLKEGNDFFSIISSAVLPTASEPIIENALNRDFYYGNPIIPYGKENLKAEDQYDENTSQTAILIGKALKQSPAKIENAITGWFAGVGQQALNLSDTILGKVYDEIPEQPSKNKNEQTVLRRFFANSYKNSNSVSEVYDKIDELEQLKAYDEANETELETLKRLNKATDIMSDLNKEIKSTRNSLKLNAQEKKNKINELQELRTDVARYYLGKELINPSNQEQVSLYEYYPASSTYKYKVNSLKTVDVEFTEADKKDYAQIAKQEYEKLLSTEEKKRSYKEMTPEEQREKRESLLTSAKNKAKEEVSKKIYKRSR